MTLEQLRIFIAVAEREHVTRAAEDLHLTQSATSAAISALESRYSVSLFDRVGRRIALTEEGRLFLAKARAVLTSAADAEALLADLGDLRTGRLVVAASLTVGSYWLPRVMALFSGHFPGIELVLELGNTEGVADGIREGRAQLGFIEGPVNDPALELEPLFEDELVLVGAAGDPLFAGDLSDRLADARWIVRESGSGTRVAMEAALASHGLQPERMTIALTLPSNEAVLTAVAAGAGVTIMSRLAVACTIGSGRLRRADMALPRRLIFALTHRDRHLGRAASRFLDTARSCPFDAGP